MNNCDNTFYNLPFSHIYVEKEALSYPLCTEILEHFAPSHPQTIPIERYQEVFGRSHQSFPLQKNSPSLILAVKHGNYLYPGAPVCQDFGFDHFYYTSFAMNCPFDCEYCYLQGMYPSSHIVLFVNLEDYFEQIHLLLQKHPVYLCISYDTDLLALDSITGCVKRYLEFASGEPLLTTELRTKSAAVIRLPKDLPPQVQKRFILAYTLSPRPIQQAFEHRTASLDGRLAALRKMHDQGFPIRLCFDPMLMVPEFKEVYGSFFAEVRQSLSDLSIRDASIGVFRISDAYLKQMRRQRPDSALLQYPFENEHHVCHYGKRSEELIAFAREQLSGWIPSDRIFAAAETTQK